MQRRLLLVLLLPITLAAMFVVAPASMATSPHFISASAAINNANGNLTVSFKEAGLGANQNINYTASADATATYVCVNKGGANPSASNKINVSGPVSASGTFNSGKNGNITASLTLAPPAAPSTFSCPGGQSKQLAEVSYTNVTITDTTNNVTSSVADTPATGCLLPDVRGAC